MMFLVLASAILVTVNGQDRDPTKVCLPDVLQLNVVSLLTNVSGVYAYNFPAKTIVVQLSDGLHAVFNLTDNKVAVTQDFGRGSCLKYSTNGQETYRFGILSQCLPAGAKLLTPVNTHLGLSPASLDIEAWELDTAGFGVVRVAVTKSSPAVPVIVQSIVTSAASGNGLITPDVQLLVNAKTSVDDSSIFDVPDDCTDWVG